MSTTRAFISHSGDDREFAEKLATDLRSNGVDAWYSEWEITPGDSLRRKIEQGLTDSDIFILILSQSSVVRPWVQEELDAAFVRRISGRCRKIIPVVIDDCEKPPFVASLLWQDMRDGTYQQGLEKVVKSIFGLKDKPPLGSPPTFIATDRESAETDYLKINKIENLRAKCLELSLPIDADAETLSVQFVSRKWGFKLFLTIPMYMECSALADLLVERLELQEHLELRQARGRFSLFWQIQRSDGHICDPDSTIHSNAISDGDTIHLHATLKEQHVSYSKSRTGEVRGMYIGGAHDVEQWTA